jgi:hypothetical protein
MTVRTLNPKSEARNPKRKSKIKGKKSKLQFKKQKGFTQLIFKFCPVILHFEWGV